MTYEDLMKNLAEAHGISEKKARRIMADALKQIVDAAYSGHAPRLKGLGNIVARPMRTKGFLPGGKERWSKPARQTLTLRTRIHRPA